MMTKIKFCGLRRTQDIKMANELLPDYAGFVFATRSKRFITFEEAEELKKLLLPRIKTVGVFVNEKPERIAKLLERGVIDIAQLHGNEDEAYVGQLRKQTGMKIIKAFRMETEDDMKRVQSCSADCVLLDSGAGTGKTFDWKKIGNVKRPYFLAGGLSPENVGEAIRQLHPFAVDVSSGIETDGYKDYEKMAAFTAAVRKEVLL